MKTLKNILNCKSTDKNLKLLTDEIINLSKHVAHDFSECIEKHCLVFRFQNHQVNVDFFAVKQFNENAVIVLLGDSIRITTSGFDERLKGAVEKLIYLSIIIVIVTDSCLDNITL